MLTINRLRNFVELVKNKIPAIKFGEVIITNDEFVSFLEEKKQADNIMLFAVAPDHGIDGKEENTQFGNYMHFFFIDKSATKNLKHSQKLDIYNNVQLAVKEFVKLILLAKAGEVEELDCGMFNDLKEESVDIKLFYDKGQCRGYEVMFYLNTVN